MSRKTKKIGQHRGRQRFKCVSCGKKFQDARRQRTRLQAELFNEYVWKKQTYAQLRDEYGKSAPWLRQQIRAHEPPTRVFSPGNVVVTADAFYFRRGIGMMVFRSQALKENLLWFSIAYETTWDYVRGIAVLEREGWVIQALVMDGRKGVREALEGRFPVQMCHFHQVAIVTRCLTQHPKLPAAIELAALTATLSRTTEAAFTAALAAWWTKWEAFTTQRTISEQRTSTGRPRWQYTHRQLRRAYRSLLTNLPYLFTFERYPKLHIPNTTNSLDGSISHLRDKLRVHRGLELTERIKLAEAFLKGKDPH